MTTILVLKKSIAVVFAVNLHVLRFALIAVPVTVVVAFFADCILRRKVLLIYSKSIINPAAKATIAAPMTRTSQLVLFPSGFCG